MKYLIVAAVTLLTLSSVSAGQMFEGWGETPSAAMTDAMDNAQQYSRAGCLGKDWAPNMERDCRRSANLGGFVCKAEGSNHRGSCGNRNQLQNIINSW